MRNYVIAGSVVAILANSEIVSVFLLVIAAAYGIYKLFSAASERSW